MSTPAIVFTDTSFLATYDRLLVPRFFSQWGELLLSKTGVAEGDRLLDIATGPGTLARIAARRIGPTGRVTAADLSSGMLAIARAKPVEKDAAPITWVESPAAPLSVESGVFDAVVCQQGLQFFPDPRAAIVEMFRALKPGGHAGIACWATIERNTVFNAYRRALKAAGVPEFAEKIRFPFSWSDPNELRVLLGGAGFHDIIVETHWLPVIFEGGPAQVIEAFGAMPFAAEIAAIPGAAAKVEKALGEILQHLLEGARVRGEMVSTVATARRPA